MYVPAAFAHRYQRRVPVTLHPLAYGCEDCTRDAVEPRAVAEARLDHGQQMLAVPREEALRLGRVEGGKLLSEHSPGQPVVRLVRVRVGDQVDLHTLLGATHCNSGEVAAHDP